MTVRQATPALSEGEQFDEETINLDSNDILQPTLRAILRNSELLADTSLQCERIKKKGSKVKTNCRCSYVAQHCDTSTNSVRNRTNGFCSSRCGYGKNADTCYRQRGFKDHRMTRKILSSSLKAWMDLENPFIKSS